MDPVRIGTGFFSVVDGVRYWRDYLKMFAHPELHCPANPPKLRYWHNCTSAKQSVCCPASVCFGTIPIAAATTCDPWLSSLIRDVAAEYSAKTRALLLVLARAISESLGLDGGRIPEAMGLESCFQILVANHYPPCSGPGGAGMGLPAHSDHGFLTLLFQNGVDGLQVERDGRWRLAKPLPGAFFVIAGDQLEVRIRTRAPATVMNTPSCHHATDARARLIRS